jgi:hypothetical protein
MGDPAKVRAAAVVFVAFITMKYNAIVAGPPS